MLKNIGITLFVAQISMGLGAAFMLLLERRSSTFEVEKRQAASDLKWLQSHGWSKQSAKVLSQMCAQERYENAKDRLNEAEEALKKTQP